jgi:hypothetical protein
MWLVLSEVDDPGACWLVQRLKALGSNSVRLLTSEDLANASKWEHRVSSDGAFVSFRTNDGEVMSSRDVHGGMSRLWQLPQRSANDFTETDRAYANDEWFAFLASALTTIPGWINPLSPAGLSGPFRSRREWAALAASAGLPTSRTRSDPAIDSLHSGRAFREVLVFEGSVFTNDVPKSVVSATVSLVNTAALRLAGAIFHVSGREWRFVDGSTVPDLRAGGPKLIRALLPYTQ